MAVPTRSDTHQDGRPTLYLVFAGLHRDARRGTGDVVTVSASAEEARQAFRAVRLQLPDREGWAELIAVTHGGKARRLSWFGVDRWPRSHPVATLVPEPEHTSPDRRLRRRSLRRR
jgi:hypothetical protein